MAHLLSQEAVMKANEDSLRWPTFPWIFWALSSSLMLHGVAYASLGFAPARLSSARPASEVEFEVAAPPPPIEPPKAPEPEPPPKDPEPSVMRTPAPAPPKGASPPAPAQAKAEPVVATAPLDLSGVTLTNAGDTGFVIRTGNGQGFAGPIGEGTTRAATAATPRAKAAVPAPVGPELVPLADLSERPVPPALESALRRNYPDEARRRAVGGSARVRARLDPDGVARRVQVESETFPGFGEACRRTLAGSSWSAPRDRSGRPVATEIRYTCRFEVEP